MNDNKYKNIFIESFTEYILKEIKKHHKTYGHNIIIIIEGYTLIHSEISDKIINKINDNYYPNYCWNMIEA